MNDENWREKFKLRFSQFEEVYKELHDVGSRLHSDPYPMVSGVYIGMFRTMMMDATDDIFESKMNVLRDVVKSYNLEYYKKVSSSGVFKE